MRVLILLLAGCGAASAPGELCDLAEADHKLGEVLPDLALADLAGGADLAMTPDLGRDLAQSIDLSTPVDQAQLPPDMSCGAVGAHCNSPGDAPCCPTYPTTMGNLPVTCAGTGSTCCFHGVLGC